MRIKWVFRLLLLTVVIWTGGQVMRAYYNNWQVEDVFQLLVEHMSGSSEREVKQQMDMLFHLKYIAKDDLPEAFFTHLNIRVDQQGGMVVASTYSVTVWPLGKVQGDEKTSLLRWLDHWRYRARFQLSFSPHAAKGVVSP